MKSVTRTRKIHKSTLLALTLSAATFATGFANANTNGRTVAAERFTEYGKVINVQPVYQDIRVSEPRQECWIETQQRIIGYESPRYERGRASGSTQRHSSSNAVVGSLIGGVIGNQLGRGHSSGSRTGATIAGAIIGGAVGNETRSSARRHRREEPTRQQGAPIYETEEVERCKQVSESRLKRQLQHYDVTYRYNGQTYTTRTKRDPGNRIALQVSVSPARQ